MQRIRLIFMMFVWILAFNSLAFCCSIDNETEIVQVDIQTYRAEIVLKNCKDLAEKGKTIHDFINKQVEKTGYDYYIPIAPIVIYGDNAYVTWKNLYQWHSNPRKRPGDRHICDDGDKN